MPVRDRPKAPSSPLILIVENDSGNRHLAEFILMREHLRFRSVASGADALAKLDTERFTLILTDLSLPDISGIDLVHQIRERARGADLPIIAITAHTQEDKIREAMNAGCADVLTKPYHAGRLMELVKQHLPLAITGARV